MNPVNSDYTPNSDQKATGGPLHQRMLGKAEASVKPYLHHPEAISGRLDALDKEWDVERVLFLKSAALLAASTYFGTTRDRRYFWIPAILSGFFAQHALSGWCLPSLIFRMAGFRTRREIDDERTALKVVRGDFAGLSIRQSPHDLLQAVEAK